MQVTRPETSTLNPCNLAIIASYCRSVCLCDGAPCEAEKLPFEEENNPATPQNQLEMTRSVCGKDKSDLYEALLQLRETQFGNGGVLFDEDASHGF